MHYPQIEIAFTVRIVFSEKVTKNLANGKVILEAVTGTWGRFGLVAHGRMGPILLNLLIY